MPMSRDTWQLLDRLRRFCAVSITNGYRQTEDGARRLVWTVALSRPIAGETGGAIRVEDQSMLAAIDAAIAQAKAKGWMA